MQLFKCKKMLYLNGSASSSDKKKIWRRDNNENEVNLLTSVRMWNISCVFLSQCSYQSIMHRTFSFKSWTQLDWKISINLNNFLSPSWPTSSIPGYYTGPTEDTGCYSLASISSVWPVTLRQILNWNGQRWHHMATGPTAFIFLGWEWIASSLVQ